MEIGQKLGVPLKHEAYIQAPNIKEASGIAQEQ